MIKNLFIFFVASLACAASVRADNAQPPVKVGIILPLSGDAAGIGAAIRNGFNLGLEKLPPEIRNRIDAHYEDDGLVTKNSVEAFYKLKSAGDVQILVNASSGTALALSTLAEKAKIPFLAIATDPEVCRAKKYVFDFWVTPEEEAKTMLNELKRRGYKKVARVTTLHNGPIALKSAFDKLNANGAVSVVQDDEYPIDIKDYRPFLTKLRAEKNVDAVIVTLLTGAGTLAREARQMGIEIPLAGFEDFEDATEVKLSGGALVGQWYVNTDDPNNSFVDLYRERFPGASLYGASNGHDAALLIGAALERGVAPADFNVFLDKLKDFKGALGTYSATGDHRFTIPAAVKIVTQKGFEKIQQQPE